MLKMLNSFGIIPKKMTNNLKNIRYMTGFSGSSATCIIIDDKEYFISDGRYKLQSKVEVKNMMDYMIALSKFNKGESTQIDILRSNQIKKIDITFQ